MPQQQATEQEVETFRPSNGPGVAGGGDANNLDLMKYAVKGNTPDEQNLLM